MNYYYNSFAERECNKDEMKNIAIFIESAGVISTGEVFLKQIVRSDSEF